ncbi:MAG: uroporphyrinogen decarboxylase family protein [Candidatus Hodarchaeota archaeon]
MANWWLNEKDSKERWEALMRGETSDRVPVFPLMLGHAGIIMGYKVLGDLYRFPKVAERCQSAAKEMYGHDQPKLTLSRLHHARCVAWGGEVEYPYRPRMSSVVCTKPPVDKPEDIERLEVPDPRVAYGDEFFEVVNSWIEQKDPFMLYVGAGMISSTAPWLIEIEKLLLYMIRQPELAHKMLDITLEYGARTLECFVEEFGTDWPVWDATPTDSNVLVSAEFFGKFVLSRMIKNHQKALDLGIPMWFTHWCADHTESIKAGHVDQIPMGNPGMIHFGPEVPLKDYVERYGNKNIIMGNVDPPSLMFKSPDEVLELCKKNIEEGMEASKGYVLACGCELPPPAPPANVYTMTKAVREYGRY